MLQLVDDEPGEESEELLEVEVDSPRFKYRGTKNWKKECQASLHSCAPTLSSHPLWLQKKAAVYHEAKKVVKANKKQQLGAAEFEVYRGKQGEGTEMHKVAATWNAISRQAVIDALFKDGAIWRKRASQVSRLSAELEQA